MIDVVPRLAALALLVTFGWAAAAKVLLPARWRDAVSGYGLARSVEVVALVLVPVGELAVVLLLATGQTRAGAALALSLVAAFSLVVVRARGLGRRRLPCGCFGSSKEVEGSTMLVRNGLLAALSALLLVAGRDIAPTDIERGDLIPVLLSVIGLAAAGWMVGEASQHLRRGRGA